MITAHKNTTLEDLRGIQMATPSGAGNHWRGLPHAMLVDSIRKEVRLRHWTILDQKFSISADGRGSKNANMVGAFRLSIPDIPPPEDQTLSMGILNSNAHRTALHMLVGTEVTSCGNGMVTKEFTLRGKHVVNFDVSEGLDEGFERYVGYIEDIHNTVASLRDDRLSEKNYEHLLFEAGRLGFMPASRIFRVHSAYNSEEHIKEYGWGNAWSLLNAFTTIVKMNPPWDQMRQMNDFRALLMGV